MIKQVIVMRTDLKNTQGQKVKSGKLIAQACHASIAFLSKRVNEYIYKELESMLTGIKPTLTLSYIEEKWLESEYRKIVLKVDSLDELMVIYNKAKAVGLEVHLITDLGMSEFGGVETVTCLAIGPDLDERIDSITEGLSTL